MNCWRTSLGGAIGVTGTALVGIGISSHLLIGIDAKIVGYTCLAGFVLSAIGKGIDSLCGADNKEVKQALQEVKDKIESNKLASDQEDTRITHKVDINKVETDSKINEKTSTIIVNPNPK